jgi:perosamine synthetase
MLRKPLVHSLYYSSIQSYEIFILAGSFLLSIFSRDYKRDMLHETIEDLYPGSKAYTYSSGRSAISAALACIKVQQGDEILVSSFTCLAVPTAVLDAGAKPIYCDVDSETLNMTVSNILQAITPKTRAIIIQHTMGIIAPIIELKKVLQGTGIIIIEDCALSIGSRLNNEFVGHEGNFSIFSMELSKAISCGWGGVLLVNDNQFFSDADNKYGETGYLKKITRLRMLFQTIVSAALNLPQFYRWKLSSFLTACLFKLKIFQPSTPSTELQGITSRDFKSKLPSELIPLAIHQWSRLNSISIICKSHSHQLADHLVSIGFSPKAIFFNANESSSVRLPLLVSNRELFISHLLNAGFEIGLWFHGPLSPLPGSKKFLYDSSRFPNSLFLSQHMINLPSHSRLNNQNIDYLKLALTQYIKSNPEESKFQKSLQRNLMH